MQELNDGLEIMFNRKQIGNTVRRMAGQILKDYCDMNPLLIGVMKGSFVFLSDLIRQINTPLEIDFLSLSSYGDKAASCGRIKLEYEPRINIRDRNVILVEDIVDTGLTTSYAIDYLKREGVDSCRLCCLLDKPSRRTVPVNIDYLGFIVPDKFLVGYGLDFNEKYRSLPDIYVIGGAWCQ